MSATLPISTRYFSAIYSYPCTCQFRRERFTCKTRPRTSDVPALSTCRSCNRSYRVCGRRITIRYHSGKHCLGSQTSFSTRLMLRDSLIMTLLRSRLYQNELCHGIEQWIRLCCATIGVEHEDWTQATLDRSPSRG
jgi:hypothetical protein